MAAPPSLADLGPLSRGLVGLDGLIRIHGLGFTLVWPALAAVAVAPDAWWTMSGLVVVCFAFNVYGYLLNNVVDLPVDRTHPARGGQWLVTGAVSTRTALTIVGPQVPLMLAAHWLFGFPWAAVSWLGAAVGLITLYDLFGKRCPIPLMMDVSLALSGVALTLYGVAATGRAANATAGWVAFSSAVYLLFINAFHNDLRDVDNDTAARQQRTAAFFGSRGVRDGRVHVPGLMALYGAALQALLIAAAVAAWRSPGAAIAQGGGRGVVLLALLALGNVALFAGLLRARQPLWDGIRLAHIFALPLPLVAALAGSFDARSVALLASAYLLPPLVLPSGQRLIHGLLGRSATPAGTARRSDSAWRNT